MADRFKINPFTGRFDNVGVVIQIGDSLYYYVGSDRYKITATLDNPALTFLLQEDGSSFFLLEDGVSKLALEA